MIEFMLFGDSRNILVPKRVHGAIGPLQWSHTGHGVRLEQVCQAIRIYERSLDARGRRGSKFNARRIDAINASVKAFVDFEVNDSFDKMVID